VAREKSEAIYESFRSDPVRKNIQEQLYEEGIPYINAPVVHPDDPYTPTIYSIKVPKQHAEVAKAIVRGEVLTPRRKGSKPHTWGRPILEGLGSASQMSSMAVVLGILGLSIWGALKR